MSQLIVTRWTVKTDGVIAPDERLPWPQTIAMGLQHVVAMFGATVLAPLLMGFDPDVCILMSGFGTLIFFVVTGGSVPSYLGSSFAFIGVVIAATGVRRQRRPSEPRHRAGRHHRLRRAVRGHRRRGDGGGHPLDRTADATHRDRGGRRGHRPQPRTDRREGRERLHLRCVDGGLTIVAVGAVAVFTHGMVRRLLILVGLAIAYAAYVLLANGMGRPGSH